MCMRLLITFVIVRTWASMGQVDFNAPWTSTVVRQHDSVMALRMTSIEMKPRYSAVTRERDTSEESER